MTEKRFNLVGSYLYDGDEVVSHFNDPSHREEIVELLNAQHEEIERLRAEEQRLYHYFRKCFKNVSEKGFRETWEVVKENDCE